MYPGFQHDVYQLLHIQQGNEVVLKVIETLNGLHLQLRVFVSPCSLETT